MAFTMKGPGSCMGTGTTGFNDKSGVLMKAPSMAPMMGTMTKPGGINFNEGFNSLPQNVQDKIDPEGNVEGNAPTEMNEMAYKKEY